MILFLRGGRAIRVLELDGPAVLSVTAVALAAFSTSAEIPRDLNFAGSDDPFRVILRYCS